MEAATPTTTEPPSKELQSLQTLKAISEQQIGICRQLDHLILLLTTAPSESTLKVLQQLVIPMATEMGSVTLNVAQVLTRTEG